MRLFIGHTNLLKSMLKLMRKLPLIIRKEDDTVLITFINYYFQEMNVKCCTRSHDYL